MKLLKTISEYMILLVIGGLIYYTIECFWRGYSHRSMFLVGGICFIFIGLINKVLSWETALPTQMLIAALIITLIELISGVILNIILKLDIWDYSDMSFHLLGQICLSYMFLWQLLSVVGIILDDFIRWKFFGEEKPKYKLL